MKVTYSIIIPHHNIPDLLKRCVNSIPKRDDTEVIVVDDGSNLESLEKVRLICRQSANNIRLIERSTCNGGGAARNTGLEHAEGEFVIFADADDYFNYCINSILTEYASSKFDIAFFKSNSVDSDTYESRYRTVISNGYIDLFLGNNKEGESKLRYLCGVPWGKIIRRSLISDHHLRFDETSIHNDTTFSYTTGYYAKKITGDCRCMYCVTQRKNSVSRNQELSKVLTSIDVFGRAVLFVHKLGLNYHEEQLYMNFYYLQKTKQFDGFLRGFQLLKKLGFNLHEAMDSYCELISKQSPRYLIDSCKHSPNKYIRKRCFDLLPHSIILALCRKFKKIYFLMHSTEFYNRFPSA